MNIEKLKEDLKYCIRSGSCSKCEYGAKGLSVLTCLNLLQRCSNALEKTVEVVRCKDCLYWQDNNGGYPHEECRWGKEETPDEDDFCSYGERKQ